MPTYEFKCSTCANAVTIMASIKEKIETPICAQCQSEMKRQFSAPPIRFNGTGFYSSGKNR